MSLRIMSAEICELRMSNHGLLFSIRSFSVTLRFMHYSTAFLQVASRFALCPFLQRQSDMPSLLWLDKMFIVSASTQKSQKLRFRLH